MWDWVLHFAGSQWETGLFGYIWHCWIFIFLLPLLPQIFVEFAGLKAYFPFNPWLMISGQAASCRIGNQCASNRPQEVQWQAAHRQECQCWQLPGVLLLEHSFLPTWFAIFLHCPIVETSIDEAEPLAETAPVEEITGAAMAASGLFVPGFLDQTYSNIFFCGVPFITIFSMWFLQTSRHCWQGPCESELPPSLLGADASHSAKTLAQSNPVQALELMASDASTECC